MIFYKDNDKKLLLNKGKYTLKLVKEIDGYITGEDLEFSVNNDTIVKHIEVKKRMINPKTSSRSVILYIMITTLIIVPIFLYKKYKNQLFS